MNGGTYVKMRPSRLGGQTVLKRMLMPGEDLVAAALAAVPRGSVSTLAALRRGMAAANGAEAACPVTTWKRIAALAEQEAAPYWRVVDPDMPSARRLAGGAERIRVRRREESGGGL